MADGILFILFNDFLPVIRLISRSRIYNEFYLVFHFDKKFIAVRLSFDKLYGMPHQLHQTVIVGKLSLAVCNISYKWGVLLYMSCDINRALYISIIVPVANILVLITGCSKENGGEAIQTTAEPSATDAASQPAEESPSFAPEEAWKTAFEESLWENYSVRPHHYEDIGSGVYQVYVEIGGKVVPFVAVDSATGEYHG